MSSAQSDTEVMARALIAAINKAVKRRPMSAIQICAALGATAAVVVAEAQPECDDLADGVALGLLGTGFVEMLPTLRKGRAN